MSKQQCNKYKVLLITFGSALETIFLRLVEGEGLINQSDLSFLLDNELLISTINKCKQGPNDYFLKGL